jgi:uncharacterized protein YegP (UPF0339 family)
MQDESADSDVTEAEFDAMLANGEPVEVTGPPADAFRRLHIELVRGDLRTYWWRLVAAGGEILATSATSYRSAENVRRAVLDLVSAMQSAQWYGSRMTPWRPAGAERADRRQWHRSSLVGRHWAAFTAQPRPRRLRTAP